MPALTYRALPPLGLLFTLAALARSQELVRLSDPALEIVGGDVTMAAPTADGQRFVFLADREVDERTDVYSVALNDPLVPLRISTHASGFAVDFRSTRDATRVVWRWRASSLDPHRLFSAPLDGSGSPVELGSGADVLEYRLDPSAQFVVFRADEVNPGQVELFRAPLDGSSAPVRLSGPLPPTGGVAEPFAIAPDGSRVVYLADSVVDDETHLHAVPLAGGSAVRIDGTIGVAGSFQITPDSSTVAFLGRINSAGFHIDAFSTPIAGGTPRLLSGGVPTLQEPFPSRDWICADSRWMVFMDSKQVYAARLDGSSGAVNLSDITLAQGAVFTTFTLTPDGRRVLYTADANVDDQHELFSAPIDGSTSSIRLSPPLGAEEDALYDLRVDPRNQRVAFVVTDAAGMFRLFSAPLDGHAPARRLDDVTAADRGVRAFAFHPDGHTIVYSANRDQAQTVELYAVPARGGTPLEISGPIAGVGLYPFLASDPVFWITPEPGSGHVQRVPEGPRPSRSSVVYVADGAVAEVFELLRVPITGGGPAVPLNPPFGFNARISDVSAYATTSSHAVYLADQFVDGQVELLSRPLDGSSAGVRLNPPLGFHGTVWSFALDPTGTRAAFRANLDINGREEVWSAPVDGSSAAVLAGPAVLNGQMSLSSFWFTPDGARVLSYGDARFQGLPEFFVAPADGSASAQLLLGVLPSGKQAPPFPLFTPDAARVVVPISDLNLLDWSIHSRVLDLSAPSIRLDPSTSNLRIPPIEGIFQLAPDGSRIVFLIENTGTGKRALYSAPVDGSAAAIQITPTPVGLANLPETISNGAPFRITPDSTRVVYASAQETPGKIELYVVSILSGPTTKLSAPLGTNRDVDAITMPSVGTRVLYRADPNVEEKFELFSVPLDGSSAAVTISGSFSDLASVQHDVGTSSDGARAFFRVARELRSAPVDGSGAVAVLNPALTASEFVANYRLLGGGSEVVMHVRETGPGELWRAAADGSGAPVLLHPPITDLAGYGPDATGTRVIFAADALDPGTVELLSTSP